MTTGQRIKAARKKARMTQADLAGKLNISYVNISQLEKDQRNPTLDTLQRIAAALGVPVQELVDDWNTVDKEEFKRVFIYGEGLEAPARIAAAMNQMTTAGQTKVADYAEDILPRYRAAGGPQEAAESTPPPPEGKDTTPPPDAPETPSEGE